LHVIETMSATEVRFAGGFPILAVMLAGAGALFFPAGVLMLFSIPGLIFSVVGAALLYAGFAVWNSVQLWRITAGEIDVHRRVGKPAVIKISDLGPIDYTESYRVNEVPFFRATVKVAGGRTQTLGNDLPEGAKTEIEAVIAHIRRGKF
jgi:hypothetical protein